MTVPDRAFSVGVMRGFLAFLHLGIAVTAFIRPNMIDLVKGYAAFGQIADTTTWGMAALLIGIGLLVIPRGSFALIVWQFFSASLFFTFAFLVTSGPTGFTWGSWTYFGLGCGSGVVMWFTAFQWSAELKLDWAKRLGERQRERQRERREQPHG